MGDLPQIDDSASVMEEGRYGYAAPFDCSGDFRHLPPRQRRAAKQRQRERQERWRKAHEARAEWTPEQFEEEEARIRAEIDAWTEGQRDAA